MGRHVPKHRLEMDVREELGSQVLFGVAYGFHNELALTELRVLTSEENFKHLLASTNPTIYSLQCDDLITDFRYSITKIKNVMHFRSDYAIKGYIRMLIKAINEPKVYDEEFTYAESSKYFTEEIGERHFFDGNLIDTVTMLSNHSRNFMKTAEAVWDYGHIVTMPKNQPEYLRFHDTQELLRAEYDTANILKEVAQCLAMVTKG